MSPREWVRRPWESLWLVPSSPADRMRCSGIRQAVIVGAGLDARAYRLPWAEGTVVFEIDQPDVLRFKAATLAEHAVVPQNSTSVHVNADLRDDWPAALRDAGFDPSVPAAWSAEGLLPYLPATGQDLLFERITELSAPDSRIAVEAFGRDFFDPEHLAQRREQMRRLREEARASGQDAPDIEDLWYFEERADVATWLAAHRWEVTSIDWHELLHRYRPGTMQRAPRTVYVEGTRN